VNIKDLRPGMEGVDLKVSILRLEEKREVTTHSGITHVLVEGEVEGDSGRIRLTVWNESIEQLMNVNLGDRLELKNCFITSFKGVLSVNVGRDSKVLQLEE
jgi:ssDNA-binding replication factor A large subunit